MKTFKLILVSAVIFSLLGAASNAMLKQFPDKSWRLYRITSTDGITVSSNVGVGIHNIAPAYTLDVTGTANISADLIVPQAYITDILNTNIGTVKITSDGPLTFGSQCPTVAITSAGNTANASIPVTVNGQLYKILIRI